MFRVNARAITRRAAWSVAAIAFITGCESNAVPDTPDESAVEDPVIQEAEDPEIASGLDGAEEPGRPLRLLSARERQQFELGKAVFNTVFTPETGLGPLFNNRSCAACHSSPVPGGAGIQIETHATTWSGGACAEFEDTEHDPLVCACGWLEHDHGELAARRMRVRPRRRVVVGTPERRAS